MYERVKGISSKKILIFFEVVFYCVAIYNSQLALYDQWRNAGISHFLASLIYIAATVLISGFADKRGEFEFLKFQAVCQVFAIVSICLSFFEAVEALYVIAFFLPGVALYGLKRMLINDSVFMATLLLFNVMLFVYDLYLLKRGRSQEHK